MNRGTAVIAKSGRPVRSATSAASAALRGADLSSSVLTSGEFELFAAVGHLRDVKAGDTLFLRGDLGTSMFLIERGEIELDFGDDLQVKRLGPNEFFGELGLLIGNHARSASAVASVDCTLIELHHQEFEALVDQDPGVVSCFLRRAIMRVVLNEQALTRRLRRRNHDLQAALDSLHATTHQLNQTEELVRTDELTGLYNRRGLMLHLQECRAIGMPPTMGLVIVDCDRFKQVNDQYGHLVGDRVLQSIASILRAVVGPDDIACRLGGDEFCLVVKAETEDEVLRFAHYIVRTAQGLLELDDGHDEAPIICPISVGASLVDAHQDWNAWYALADAALYRAKRLGGDRVEWQDASEPLS